MSQAAQNLGNTGQEDHSVFIEDDLFPIEPEHVELERRGLVTYDQVYNTPERVFISTNFFDTLALNKLRDAMAGED